jgi:hypothetical protein
MADSRRSVRQHPVLSLSGVSHRGTREDIAEHLLLFRPGFLGKPGRGVNTRASCVVFQSTTGRLQGPSTGENHQ